MKFRYQDTIIDVPDVETVLSGQFYELQWGAYSKYIPVSELTPIDNGQ